MGQHFRTALSRGTAAEAQRQRQRGRSRGRGGSDSFLSPALETRTPGAGARKTGCYQRRVESYDEHGNASATVSPSLPASGVRALSRGYDHRDRARTPEAGSEGETVALAF